ncbi:exonuclease domain-containing protein, partial [Vibrio splendidus]
VDFGLIVVDGKTLEDLSTVSQLILPYPEMKMATYCKSMTGITDEMLVDKPSFNEFLPEFESLLNTYADMVFLHWGGIESSSLHKEFERCQKKVPISVVFYDLQPLVSRKFGERQISLKSAANLLNIELDLETHRAVNDAIYLGFILKALKSEYSA